MAPTNYAKYNLPVLYKWNEAWIIAYQFITWFTEYFKLNVETYHSEKTDFFQNITAH